MEGAKFANKHKKGLIAAGIIGTGLAAFGIYAAVKQGAKGLEAINPMNWISGGSQMMGETFESAGVGIGQALGGGGSGIGSFFAGAGTGLGNLIKGGGSAVTGGLDWSTKAVTKNVDKAWKDFNSEKSRKERDKLGKDVATGTADIVNFLNPMTYAPKAKTKKEKDIKKVAEFINPLTHVSNLLGGGSKKKKNKSKGKSKNFDLLDPSSW